MAVREVLSCLRMGKYGIKDLYRLVMERINHQSDGGRALAGQVLSWVTYAQRPLTVSELQYALCSEPEKPGSDESKLTNVKDIVSSCAGLVVIDEGNHVVRLVHHTAREYLRDELSRLFPGARTKLASVCFEYLSLDLLDPKIFLGKEEAKKWLQRSVYQYAADHWGHHAQGAHRELEPAMLDFLSSRDKVSAANQVMGTRSMRPFIFLPTQRTTAMHLVAYFGLSSLVQPLKCRYDVGAVDDFGRTPLAIAVLAGQQETVDRMITFDVEDVDSIDHFERTPLHLAVRRDDEKLVLLLFIKGAIVDFKDYMGQTPLMTAVKRRLGSMVKLLLRCGADEKKAEDAEGWTPLTVAARDGLEEITKLLLKSGANLEARVCGGQTALMLAATHGHVGVARLLVEYGADIETEDRFHRTAMTLAVWAVEVVSAEMIELLKKANKDRARKGFKGKSQTAAKENVEEGAEEEVEEIKKEVEEEMKEIEEMKEEVEEEEVEEVKVKIEDVDAEGDLVMS